MAHRFADPFELPAADGTEQLPHFEHRASSSSPGLAYWSAFALISFGALALLTPLAS